MQEPARHALQVLRTGPRYVVGFHTSDGDTSYFDAIAEALPAAWGTATISSRSLGLDDLPESLDALAAIYRAHLAEQLGGAPVVLGGWGFGGLIALACAQGAPAGSPPLGLFALETKLPEPGWEHRPTDLATLARVLAEHRARWAELPVPTVEPEGTPPERLRRALASIGIATTAADAEHELLRFQRHIRGVVAFRAEPTRLPCLLFTAEAAGHDLGWGPIAPHATQRTLPGTHYTIARPANRPAIAAAITAFIEPLR
jgi:thioesterase domain-containing protein